MRGRSTVAVCLAALAVGLLGRPATAAEEYVEMLVKTSDNVLSRLPRGRWTDAMRAEERAGCGKQGYIVRVEPEGYAWGRLEKDPKRYAIIKVPKSQFEAQWLEPEVDAQGKVVTQRRFRLPLEGFLTGQELGALKSIPYNDRTTRPAIRKTVTDIRTRVQAVDWARRPPDLRLHGSAGTFAIRAAGGDYTKLSTWEDAEDCDLTGQGPCIAECYNDWPEGLEDNVVINGWTTTANDYIEIRTPASQRHTGREGTGFRMRKPGATLISSRESDVKIVGLELFDAAVGVNLGEWEDLANAKVSHNLIHKLRGGAGTRGIASGRLLTASIFFNNIIYDVDRIGIYLSNSGSAVKVYNNTVFKCNLINDVWSGGIQISAAPNSVCKNNAAFQNLNKDYYGASATQNGGSHNASSDATGCEGLKNLAAANQFVNAVIAGADLHLKAAAGLMDVGTALSTDFTDDVDGNTRSGAWDIGADERVPAGPVIYAD